MGRAIFTHSARRMLRTPALVWLVTACVLLSVLATIVPVRFRDPTSFLLESLQSIQLLAGLGFAAISGLRDMHPDRFAYTPPRWGVPAVSALRVVFVDALAGLTVLGLLLVVVAVLQAAVLLVLGRLGTDLLLDLIDYLSFSYAFSAGLLAWARLIGSRLPGGVGLLLLSAVAVGPEFLASRLAPGPDESWRALATWKLAILALAPAPPPGAENRDMTGLVWLAGAASAQLIAANLVIAWSLEHLRGDRGALDRFRGGS